MQAAFLAAWAALLTPMALCAVLQLVASLDWFPTVLGLAGVALPVDRTIDGVDQHDLLFGQGPSKRTEFLYLNYRAGLLMAVRIGPWKLHVQTQGSHAQAP